MNELEKEIREAQIKFSRAVDSLVDRALSSTDTYEEAIKNLKQFEWKLTGRYSSLLLDEAIKKIEKIAVGSKIAAE